LIISVKASSVVGH